MRSSGDRGVSEEESRHRQTLLMGRDRNDGGLSHTEATGTSAGAGEAQLGM